MPGGLSKRRIFPRLALDPAGLSRGVWVKSGSPQRSCMSGGLRLGDWNRDRRSRVRQVSIHMPIATIAASPIGGSPAATETTIRPDYPLNRPNQRLRRFHVKSRLGRNRSPRSPPTNPWDSLLQHAHDMSIEQRSSCPEKNRLQVRLS